MPLKNYQYNSILRRYDARRLESHRRLEERRRLLYEQLPELSEIDNNGISRRPYSRCPGSQGSDTPAPDNRQDNRARAEWHPSSPTAPRFLPEGPQAPRPPPAGNALHIPRSRGKSHCQSRTAPAAAHREAGGVPPDAERILERWHTAGVHKKEDIAVLDAEFARQNTRREAERQENDRAGTAAAGNRFNAFPQRKYSASDYSEMEKQLLGSK